MRGWPPLYHPPPHQGLGGWDKPHRYLQFDTFSVSQESSRHMHTIQKYTNLRMFYKHVRITVYYIYIYFFHLIFNKNVNDQSAA